MAAGSYGGSTRLVALLGQPVARSLSPRMQNAAFAARGLDWAYVACEVAPERLEEAIRGLAALGFAGANVTIPHKEAAAALCDEADGDAVNTLVFRDGRVLGSNTDREILRGIEATRACLIGAGGAAKALLPVLPADTRVFSRRGDWPPDAAHADLVVNATPVRDELLVEPRPEQAVVDLAYRPDGRPTALVAAAHAAGCREVVNGLEALVRQGAASFERWTGVAAPVEVMRAALGLTP
jgi:shikimate dehydrogenase